MDNYEQLLLEYNTLLTEKTRLMDYLRLVNLHTVKFISAMLAVGDIDQQLAVCGKRLERMNLITEILEGLP